MRVITEGRYIEERAYCPHCNAILGYYPGDVQIRYGHERSKVQDWKYIGYKIWYLRCPRCGGNIDLEEEDHQ